jgi:hypothetical protein
VSSRADLDAVKRNLLPLPGIEPRPSSLLLHQLLVHHSRETVSSWSVNTDCTRGERRVHCAKPLLHSLLLIFVLRLSEVACPSSLAIPQYSSLARVASQPEVHISTVASHSDASSLSLSLLLSYSLTGKHLIHINLCACVPACLNAYIPQMYAELSLIAKFLTFKSSVFWDMMPCNLLKADRRFGVTFHFYLQDRKAEATE